MARAFEETLYWSDIRQVVPLDATVEDSAALANAYINNWIRQRVVLRKAEENLAAEQKDFEAKLADYRNSLIIFTYEQALVDQKLDTALGRSEVEEYYEKNRDNFELRDNILRLRWFKVRESDKRTLKKLQDHFMSGDAGRMREVELWLAQRNVPIVDRSAQWSTLTDLRSEIPVLAAQGSEDQLGEGRTVLRDLEGGYFVDILELRRKDSVSPLALVEADIRSILINQRKLQLLERMREDVHQDAQANGHVEVY
ncbi:MAG: hypothetical protein WEC15_04255 [Flavobacteriales bacterium]